jgi:hypothetical protein
MNTQIKKWSFFNVYLSRANKNDFPRHKYYLYLATGATFEKRSEKPIGISRSFEKKNHLFFRPHTHTVETKKNLPSLSAPLQTLSITIRLPVSSTLLAISPAVDGVRGQFLIHLIVPWHCWLSLTRSGNDIGSASGADDSVSGSLVIPCLLAWRQQWRWCR